MTDERLTLRDGRTLAFCQYGPVKGRPVLRFHGTPSSRFARHPDEGAYDRLNVRVIASDRPGYGASTRLPGRGIAVVAHDAAELLDHLGLDTVHASGSSGGGPHVLAFAALHPERVRAATVVVGGGRVIEEEVRQMIESNQASWHAARQGWDVLYRRLAPLRERLVADPLGGFRGLMEDAPPSDKAVMEDPAWQRRIIEDVSESLRPGAEGWTDDGIAMSGPAPWDFNPSDVRCSVTWWHGDRDANAPLSAARRVVARIARAELRIWVDAGHFEPYLRHDEILGELLSR